MATPPPKSAAPHPANIALHHRLAKLRTNECVWRMFDREYARFQQIAKTCQGTTALDERGRMVPTPEAASKLKRFGAIYSHFFAAVAMRVGNDVTPQQRDRLWRASLEANACM